MNAASLKRILPFCILALLSLMLVITPYYSADAATKPPSPFKGSSGLDVGACVNYPDEHPEIEDWMLTSRIVQCFTNIVGQTTSDMLSAISDYMKPFAIAFFTLSVAIFGIRVMNGDRYVSKTAFGFLIRLSIVSYFSYQLGNGFGMQLFGMQQDMASISLGTTPWRMVDISMGKLLGFGPMDPSDPNSAPILLSNGILGIVGAAMYSTTTGSYLFIAGLGAISSFIAFIFRSIYTYLFAVMCLAFLIVISPIIIPYAIFELTHRYVKRWLDLVISSLVLPLLLFGFISLFIGIFNSLILDIVGIVGPYKPDGTLDKQKISKSNPDFTSIQRTDQPLEIFGGSWMNRGDPGFANMFQNNADRGAGLGKPGLQATPNNYQSGSDVNINPLSVPTIDFGKDQIVLIQQLTYDFILLLIFSELMKQLINRMPQIAADISQGALDFGLERLPFEDKLSRGFKNAMNQPKGGSGNNGRGGRRRK